MRDKVVGQDVERLGQIAGWQIVDRLDQRTAEQQRPGPIDRLAGEGAILADASPSWPTAARSVPSSPSNSLANGTLQGIVSICAGLAILDLVGAVHVANAAKAVSSLAEEGGQALKVALLPGLERMVVALGAVDPHAQEGPRRRGPPADSGRDRGRCRAGS